MGQGGGNQRTLWYILKFLDRAKFNPIILSPEETEFLARFRSRGVELLIETPPASIHRFGGQVLREGILGRLRSALDVLRYNIRLARLMRARQIDLIYCNSIRALLLAGFGARWAGVPSLWYVKGELQNALLDRVGFLLANKILYFCESNRDDRYPLLVRTFKKKIGIIRIGIDPDVIAAAEAVDKRDLIEELDIRPDRINAIILGQVYPPKGQHFVLEGLREIVDAHPSFMLYIAGDHVLAEYKFYRAHLDSIIQRDHLEDHVRFTGWRTDALQILATMDLAIHPSLAEGFGRAVLEAMALGRAVVASAVGGLREIIRDGENGFLVSPRDTPALVDRIKLLAGNPQLRARLGAAAKREVMQQYLIEDKIRALESVWQEMAS
jgi:glycosyltransferase involved in cell wall biosynthesis